jgi:hypothetical protein
MNNQHVKKKVVFFKTSQLNNGGFAYIWYPLIKAPMAQWMNA